MALAEAPMWPVHGGTMDESFAINTGGSPVYLSRETMPPGLAERWQGRVPVVDYGDTNAPTRRDMHVMVSITPGRQVGRFVRIGFSYQGWSDVPDDVLPSSAWRGRGVVLLDTPDGWVVVGGWWAVS